MKQETLTIREQIKLADGIYKMVLEAGTLASSAHAGQFINLYCRDKSLLLPRPISLYDIDPEQGTVSVIYAVVGKGTEEFAHYQAGERVKVLGPLGNGFPVEEAKEAEEILLVGGGLGIPPMYQLAKELSARCPNTRITAFLGFRGEAWTGEEFAPYAKVLCASDNGACGFKGNVVDRMRLYMAERDPGKPRVLYACGPVPMLKAVQKWQADYPITSWFSLEERMGCGFGACAGCPAKLRLADGSVVQKGVCKLGPVFPGKDVIFDAE